MPRLCCRNSWKLNHLGPPGHFFFAQQLEATGSIGPEIGDLGWLGAAFREGSGGFRRVPEGSGGFRRVPEGSGGFRRVPEGSGGFRRVPEGSGGFRRVPEGSGGFRRVPEGSGGFRRVPEGSGGFRRVPEGSGAVGDTTCACIRTGPQNGCNGISCWLPTPRSTSQPTWR